MENAPAPRFENSIPVDVAMPVSEVVAKIAAFHKVPTQNVLDAFLNLRTAEGTDTGTFEKSVSNGRPCLKIEVHGGNG